MANYWTAPKTNWIANDAIGYEDLNRIEANTKANRDANFRRVQGFGYTMDNSVSGYDGIITVLPGSAYSSDGFPMRRDTNFVKNLTSWVQGSGNDKGGMASAVTVAAYTWYYIFALLDPTNGNIEIMFDDNPAGTNVSSGVYTKKRYINSFKTGAAGGDGSFDIIEMFSTGDRVMLNPDSGYAERGWKDGILSDYYNEITLLQPGRGYLLPARDILAQFTILTEKEIHAIGLISDYGNYFTIPSTFKVSGRLVGEYVFQSIMPVGDHNYGISADCDIRVDTDRKVNIAVLYDSGSPEFSIGIRAYTDLRLQ